MASTYSPNLKLELMANGDQSGTWGNTTNNNLGTLVEQAICGVTSAATSTDITMMDADYTLSNLNGAVDQARMAVLNVGGTNLAVRNIIAPSGQTKTYIVVNNTAGGYAIGIKAGSSGVAINIPNGATEQVWTDGTTFYHIGMATISGGTTGLTPSTPTTGDVVLSGVLSTSNGGTGVSSPTAGYVLLGNGSGSLLGVPPTISGNILTADGSSWVSAPNGGVGAGVSSVGLAAPSLFTVTGSPVTGVGTLTFSYSGTALPVAYGGTGGSATPTTGGVAYGTGTAYAFLTPGAAGTILTSGGSGVPPSWAPGGTISSVSGTPSQITASTAGGAVSLSLPSPINVDTSGSAATAFNPAGGGTFITSINIGAQSVSSATIASSPAGGGTFITSLNIGTQSVSSATNATNATNAATATSATSATNLVGSGTISANTTATTKSYGTGDTTVATTAFVSSSIVTFVNAELAAVTGTSGYQHLGGVSVGGMIMQWGSATIAGYSSLVVTLPTAFPTQCINVQTTFKSPALVFPVLASAVSTTTITLQNPDSATTNVYWLALGY